MRQLNDRRWTGVVLLLLIMLSQTAVAEIVTPEVRKVADRFICQCGCNHQLSVCSMQGCSSAVPLRQEIADDLKAGMTEAQIVNSFIQKYGKTILSAPTTQGFDLTAWTLPFVVLLAGFIFVYFVLKAWLRRRVPAVVGATRDLSIPEEYRQRIEKELDGM